MPTQNLKTRVIEALDQAEKACASRNCVSSEGEPHQWCNQQKNAVSALLSSELSLVINELREAVEERMRPPKSWSCNCTEYRRDANECTCGAEYDQMKASYDEALSAFDIKYKELQEKL